MSNIRIKLSRLTTKKVPLISLLLVATVGMVVGVLAATITVTSNSYTGEIGTYHTTSSGFTVTDKGLGVAANTVATNITTAVTQGATGSNKVLNNAMTAGDWMETLTFTDTGTDATGHVPTVTIRSGTGPQGLTTLASSPITVGTITGPGSASTGTITVYIDLGVTSLATPVTVYVNIT
jgi:hypothetical protein